MSFTETPFLENEFARLEPLSQGHGPDLAQAVSVGELWRTWYTTVPTPEDMNREIETRLEKQRAGTLAPWAIIDPSRDSAVGMTTYLNIDSGNRRVEIGSTWMGKDAQGTGINPGAKLLLLTRAFEALDCIAVEFRTHFHNQQSRAAIVRLGAKQDGILRNHMLWRDGTRRDTVVFSVLDSEWPTVRLGLEERLARRKG
jgi:RimJ/RimL family protein N-acetyltransferase